MMKASFFITVGTSILAHASHLRSASVRNAYLRVRNRLGTPIANVRIEHLYGCHAHRVYAWDDVQSGQVTDKKRLRFIVDQDFPDFWAASWETADGEIGCRLLPAPKTRPQDTCEEHILDNYVKHHLERKDTDRATTIDVSVGPNGPRVSITSASGRSKRDLVCRWLSIGKAVDEDSLARCNLVNIQFTIGLPGSKI